MCWKHTPSRKIRQKVDENNVIGADDPAIPGKKIEGSLEPVLQGMIDGLLKEQGVKS